MLIIPIGDDHNDQVLKKVVKENNDINVENIVDVRFVPLLEGKESI